MIPRTTGRGRALTPKLSRHLLMGCMSLALVIGGAATSSHATEAAAPLDELNAQFRALYHERTAQVVSELPLVLIVQNSLVTAVRGDHRRLYPVPIQAYNEARSIMHALLGFHGLMNSLRSAGPSADWSRAQAFVGSLDRLQQELPHTSLNSTQQALAGKVVISLRASVVEAIKRQAIDEERIAQTLAKVQPIAMQLVKTAGQQHAAYLRQAFERAKKDATPEEWQKAIAVVTGPSTPRRKNLETAVTAAVLGKELLGTRIFYAENIFTVEGALSFLQTLMGDKELSQNMFAEPHRMWRDLFAPVSDEVLESVDFYSALP